MKKRILNLIVRFYHDTKGAQLVEEGLLICVSLFLVTIVLGVVQSVTTMMGELFAQAWNSLETIARGLFDWMHVI
jgi:Flp pilus assembly pilin Flp